MHPEDTGFELKCLTIKSSDDFSYSFVSYHSIMSEFKSPVTQDKKIKHFLGVLMNIRHEVSKITSESALSRIKLFEKFSIKVELKNLSLFLNQKYCSKSLKLNQATALVDC